MSNTRWALESEPCWRGLTPATDPTGVAQQPDSSTRDETHRTLSCTRSLELDSLAAPFEPRLFKASRHCLSTLSGRTVQALAFVVFEKVEVRLVIRLTARALEDVLVKYLHERSPSLRRPSVLGIGGFPYTGKSHLAHIIRDAWQLGRAAILPTESAILPRAARLKHNTDGCSPASHDMRLLLEQVTTLCEGQAIQLREYSWSTGNALGTTVMEGLCHGDLLIIDGSVAAAPPIASRCDLLVLLYPAQERQWLPVACERDILERGWDPGEAYAQNLRKAKTSARLGILPEARQSIYVQVDPISWARFIPECSNYEHPTPRLSASTAPHPIQRQQLISAIMLDHAGRAAITA